MKTMKHPRDDRSCWCGAGQWNVRIRTHRLGLLQCQDCGCHRIDPPPISQESEAAEFYSDYYQIPQPAGGRRLRPFDPKRSSRFWKVAGQHSTLPLPGRRVLDVGCGGGGLCAELVAQGWNEVYGFDISSSGVALARKRHPGITFFSDLAEIPSSLDEWFNLLIMDNVIEHLINPAEYLEGLRRYLQPKGRIVVITPNMNSGQFRLLGRFWTQELAPHTHIYLFTEKSLCRLLQLAGFEVEQAGSVHLDLRLPALKSAKEFAWRMAQELGVVYGRVLGQGSMVYVVATPRKRI